MRSLAEQAKAAEPAPHPTSPLDAVQAPIRRMLDSFLKGAETPAQALARRRNEQASQMAAAVYRTRPRGNVYEGTVRPNVVAKRRARNRAARATRKAQHR